MHPQRKYEGRKSAVEPTDQGDQEATPLFEDILNTGASLRVKVTGESMAPFLRSGEIVAIRKVPCASLRRGDVVFFKDRRGSPVLHRLIRKSTSSRDTLTIQTKGDALLAFDEPVSCDRILGKVWRIEKGDSGLGKRPIRMESAKWRFINCLLAMTSALKSSLLQDLSRVRRGLSRFFQGR